MQPESSIWHELQHCHDLARQPQTELGLRVTSQDAKIASSISMASTSRTPLGSCARWLRYLVPDAVADFIRNEGLYRGRPELVLERPVEVEDVPVDPAS
jgi:nicotinic acid mononucleotide adenylyltransferase